MKLFLIFVVIIVSLKSIASDETRAEENCEAEYKEICQANFDLPKTQVCTDIMMEKLSTQCKQRLDSATRLNSFSSFAEFDNPVSADKQSNSLVTED